MTAGAVALFLLAPLDSAWQVGAFLVPSILAASLVAARAVRSVGRSGLSSRVLLVAQVGYLVANVFWYAVPLASGSPLPFPSFVDALFFAAYAGYAVFLLLVLRARAEQQAVEGRIALTDALIFSTSLSAVLWVGVVQPNLASGIPSLSKAVALAYPAFTLLLFVLAARLAFGGDLGRSMPALLLVVWVGTEIVGDAVYGLQSANGTFHYGGLLSVTWMVSSGALAAMVAHPEAVSFLTGDHVPAKPRPTAVGRPGLGRTARHAALLGAAVLTVVMSYLDPRRSVFLLAASVVAVVLVAYRTSVLSGDLQRERVLAAELDEAVTELRDQQALLERQAARLERMAFHDSVTGLGNRALLHQRAAAAPGPMTDTTLLLLDLDGFKEVNDTLGHAAGDALLFEVGDRLGRCVRTADTVVRLGGDEFAMFLPDTGRARAALTAERILGQLREPFLVDGVAVAVRGSIGIASGSTGADLDELLRRADLAMYAAKNSGRDQTREFDPSLYLEPAQRRGQDAELRAALVRDELAVHYQPIVDTPSGRVVAVESLVRWDHPERGELPPAQFLPTAERTGLIVELGRFVLRTACRHAVQWRAEWPELVVAVNVSHQELLVPTFAEDVADVLGDTGLPPAALHLEITETVLAAEESVLRIIQPLARLGVKFSIDDFGTGHSSLSRLRGLNVDRLKLDRSFIAEIDDADSADAPLLASIISLSHSVGLRVVAEGVETLEQAAYLAEHGCDELQGYLFSRPVPPEGIPALLRSPALGSRLGAGSHSTSGPAPVR